MPNDGAAGLYATADLDRAVAELSPVLVMALDPDGRIVYVNERLEQLCGRSLAELRGCEWLAELVPAAEREQARGSSLASSVWQLPIMASGGGVRLIEWRTRALACTSAAAPGLVAVGVDIGEQRRAVEQREHLQRVLDSMAVLVAIIEPSGRLRQLNRFAHAALGVAVDADISSTQSFDFTPICSPAAVEAFHRAAAGQPARYDLVARGADGREAVFDVSLGPVFDEHGELRKLVASGIDVTDVRDNERRLRESLQELAVEQARQRWVESELRASLVEKDALLQEIHHRVKNNLQVVASLLYLSGTTATEDVRAVLDECRIRIRSMVLIHEQLYMSGELSRIDMREFLTKLTAELGHVFVRGRAPEINVVGSGMTLAIDRAVPLALAANELLINALKYAYPDGFEGCSEIRVEVNPDSLVIEDHGIGLPPEAELSVGGTLGLRLVRTLARQVGADLEFSRERGTRVRLLLA